MACGCQKNKGNTASVNKAVRTEQRPNRPITNGRVSRKKKKKRIIR